jgi:hypothetical protein
MNFFSIDKVREPVFGVISHLWLHSTLSYKTVVLISDELMVVRKIKNNCLQSCNTLTLCGTSATKFVNGLQHRAATILVSFPLTSPLIVTSSSPTQSYRIFNCLKARLTRLAESLIHSRHMI